MTKHIQLPITGSSTPMVLRCSPGDIANIEIINAKETGGTETIVNVWETTTGKPVLRSCRFREPEKGIVLFWKLYEFTNPCSLLLELN